MKILILFKAEHVFVIVNEPKKSKFFILHWENFLKIVKNVAQTEKSQKTKKTRGYR